VRAGPDDGTEIPADEVRTTVLGPDPSPLAVLEGTVSLLEMDRGGIGTPMGDLEGLSPR
jgi:hypothetical protein